MLVNRDSGQDAKAEVTRDMLQGMLDDFDRLSNKSGVLQMELRGNSLYVLQPDSKTFEFVGLARTSPALAYLR